MEREEFYCSLTCTCEASFELNTGWAEVGVLAFNRFIDAHVKCGYVLPSQNVEYNVKLQLPPEDLAPDDETVESVAEE